jgi:hypothetical protein
MAAAPGGYEREVEPVIVNVVLGQDGAVLDAEPLQNNDPLLSNAALALVPSTRYRAPGKSPGQREAFINGKFVARH